jgi:hypothetical protein
VYSTCLFCNRSLGANQVIEAFPVGRRLAFDSAKGRLWVVCTHCERWNLSPLEERWEAIEECERLFSDTRLRVSTENVGLARLSEGLTLIRIGAPQRPEMAAWRYGDQFGRRRRSAMVKAGLGLGVLGIVVIGGATAGVGLGGVGYALTRLAQGIISGNPNAVVARIPGPDERVREIKRKHLERVRLVTLGGPDRFRLSLKARKETLEYTGDEALRVAGVLLPPLNRYGGSKRQVESAVRLLDDSGSPTAAFAMASARALHPEHDGKLHSLEYPIRLALEMAAHEESERRALQGELGVLERAWREAEEIAEISDTLLLPSTIDDWLARLRGPRSS